MSHDDAISTVRLACSELDRLRAALAAEQAAHAAQRERAESAERYGVIVAGDHLAAIERAEQAERERDEARAAVAAILDEAAKVRRAREHRGMGTGLAGLALAGCAPSAIAEIERLAREGAPLLAEVRWLRSEVERLRSVRDVAKGAT